jgi:hypothetical protein
LSSRYGTADPVGSLAYPPVEVLLEDVDTIWPASVFWMPRLCAATSI